jgi:hypothetical protein
MHPNKKPLKKWCFRGFILMFGLLMVVMECSFFNKFRDTLHLCKCTGISYKQWFKAHM